MATRVTFRTICVAGLIPIKTTLTGGGTEVALEALIQALARMLIIVPVVSDTLLFSCVYCNMPFSSCCEPHYESEAKCKTFHMKISFVCI